MQININTSIPITPTIPTTPTTPTTPVAPQTNASAQANAAVLEQLESGDMFQGKVIERRPDGLLLRLDNGMTLLAEDITDASINPGDTLTLMVDFMGETQVSLRLMTVTPGTATLAGQLQQQGVDVSGFNAAVLRAFEEANIPVQPELIRDVLQALSQHADLTPAKALFLVLNEITIEQPQIDALNQLIDDKMLTGHALQMISKALEQEDAHIATQSETSSAAAQPAETQNAAVQNAAQTVAEPPTITQPPTFVEGLRQQSPMAAGFVTLLNLASEAEDMVAKAAAIPPESDQAAVLGFVDRLPPGLPPAAREALIQSLYTAIRQQREDSSLGFDPRGTTVSHDANNLRDTNQALVSRIESLFAKLETESSGKALRDTLRGLKTELTAIRETLLAANAEPALQQVEQTLQRQQLMDDVQHFLYAQIPFALHQQQTAELYVMKRDRRKGAELDAENVTMLIALQTEHIGRVESLIKVEKKNVSIQFRVSDMNRAAVLKTSMASLKDMLAQAGYQLRDLRLQPLDTPVTPMNIGSVIHNEFTPATSRRILDLEV